MTSLTRVAPVCPVCRFPFKNRPVHTGFASPVLLRYAFGSGTREGQVGNITYRNRTQKENPDESSYRLKRLNPRDRISVLEAAMKTLCDELPAAGRPKKANGIRRRLAAAARELRADYQAGGELTVFTMLD